MAEFKKVTQLPAICVDDEFVKEHFPDEATYPYPFLSRKSYILLGEVSEFQDGKHRGIGHYIIMELATGETFRGMWHSDLFRYITPDDDFF